MGRPSGRLHTINVHHIFENKFINSSCYVVVILYNFDVSSLGLAAEIYDSAHGGGVDLVKTEVRHVGVYAGKFGYVDSGKTKDSYNVAPRLTDVKDFLGLLLPYRA
ncbi:unnamed protein product [Dovyalis caffra]|uniref:Uncharacterized protein n=1 Tax=Dovyalis caffra TaxID=77055 RepID=A0AAV1RN60_9ROSI|nr:unnamed protein product [Dovyalis caffra]